MYNLIDAIVKVGGAQQALNSFGFAFVAFLNYHLFNSSLIRKLFYFRIKYP